MKSSLIAGLDKEQERIIEGEFKYSALLRKRIIDLLKARNESNRIAVRQKTSYESPSWAYEQADAIGYERAIYELISLLSEESGEKTSKTK